MATAYSDRTWVNPKLTVRSSTIDGQGVFARRPIEKDERLMVFGGDVVATNDLDKSKHRLYSAFPLSASTVIVLPVSVAEESIDEFLNHSCDPNAWMIDEVTVVARRDIGVDEEITVDVATWDNDESWPYCDDGVCKCGSSLCRGTLSARDWIRSELQSRYEGHFVPYLAELIAGRRSTDEGHS